MSNNTIQIVEQFLSHQGEVQAGQLAYFIRTAGCMNKCKHCDTKHSWPKTSGTTKTIDEVVDDVIECYNKILDLEFSNNRLLVVITGGEPLLWQEELNDIIFKIKQKTQFENNITFAIETSGNVSTEKHSLMGNLDIINCSPKTPCLEAETIVNSSYIIQIIKHMERSNSLQTNLKFVVKNKDDIGLIKMILEILSKARIDEEVFKRVRVWLMPFTEIKPGELDNASAKINDDVKQFVAETAVKYGWDISPRFHIDMKIE